jgi:cAMP-specific phosphodiesterase 4
MDNVVVADKQQDLPEFKVEDVDKGQEHTAAPGKKSRDKKAPMSHISGVRRLKHTNSFSAAVPKYGIESPNEEELSSVRGQSKCYVVFCFNLIYCHC